MEKRITVSLSSFYDEFINSQILSGKYNSTSELIRDGIRLLKEKEEKKNFWNAIEEGEKSGYTKEYNPAAHLNELNNKYGSKK